MILGVALVVDELNKGQRLAFRYPESVPESQPELSPFYKQFHSLSHENFSKLFRPKKALLNRLFEITIEDIHYISYPCPCASTPEQQPTVASSGSKSDAENSSETGGNAITESITMFNVIFALVTTKAMNRAIPNFLYKCQSKYFSTPGTDPVASAMGLRHDLFGICCTVLRKVIESVSKALVRQEKKGKYITIQTTTILKLIDNIRESEMHDKSSSGLDKADTKDESAGFVAVPPPFPIVRGRSRRAASNASNNSNQGNSQSDFGTPLPTSIISTTGEAAGQHTALDSTSEIRTANSASLPGTPSYAVQTSLPRGPSNFNSFTPDGQNDKSGPTARLSWNINLLNMVLAQSRLANELRILYHSLVGGNSVNISFNGERAANFSLSCKDPKQCEDSVRNLLSKNSSVSNNNRMLIPSSTLPESSSHGTLQNIRRHSFGKQVNLENEYHRKKIRGINPSTQTMLTIADSLTIMNVLNAVDGNSIKSTALRAESSATGIGTGKYLTNSRLFSFVEAADPTQSFLDLSIKLDEPVEELLSMASYLQSWALADIIPVLTSESRYKIHPNAPTSITAHVTRAFEAFLLGLGIHLYDSRNNCSGTTEKKGDILDYSAHQLNRWFDDCTSTTNSNSDGPTTAQLIMAQKQQTARQARKRSYSTEDQFFASNRHYRYPPVSNSTGFAPPAPSVVGRSVVYGPNENFSTFQNDASFPAVQVDGGFSCIDLDNANIPARYSLINVATIFDGDRKFGDVIKSLPSRLRVYGVDIAVFLLRWRMIVEIDSFIENCLFVPYYCEETREYILKKDPKGWFARAVGSIEESGGIRLNSSSNDLYQKIKNFSQAADLNFARDVSHSADFRNNSMQVHFENIAAKSRDPSGKLSDTSGEGNFENSLPYERRISKGTAISEVSLDQLNISSHNPSVTFQDNSGNLKDKIVTEYVRRLNRQQRQVYDRLAQYIQSPQSSKSISEILLYENVSEEQLLDTIRRLPFLRVVRRITT